MTAPFVVYQLSAIEAVEWSVRLIAFACLLQSIEFLQIKSVISESGVWRWSALRRDYRSLPRPFMAVIDPVMSENGFTLLLMLRLLASVLLLFISHPALLFFVLVATLTICVRWRGVFNGGSDYMTVIVLGALTLACSSEVDSNVAGRLREGSLWYITIQSCLSYFLSGFAKLRNPNWRSGDELARIFSDPRLGAPALMKRLLRSSVLRKAAARSTLVFECTFPLALLNPSLCLFYIGLGVLFHVTNVYAFGLNRFLFAWAATYPALYYCSQVIRS